ncbi:MAG: hypothetical protein LQ342_000981 [Letrouitia transgressa]|nr:MAG: hypothetical protein LQ342_000981 [Letrouitia transgressa]
MTRHDILSSDSASKFPCGQMPEQTEPSPQLIGSTFDLYQGTIAESARREAEQLQAQPNHFALNCHKQNNFKSVQWSPDGTTLLASSASQTLSTFILPPNLLTHPTPPQPLTPYATHHNPEPVYATAFHPSYSLAPEALHTALYLASPADLPIRLLSPFSAPSSSSAAVATYPFVHPATDAFTAPHSLCFFSTAKFFAGAANAVALFDLERPGEGPVRRMRTCVGRRSRQMGARGIVSAMSISRDGLLAVGTFGRWVGLYDGNGEGGAVAAFPVASTTDAYRPAASGAARARGNASGFVNPRYEDGAAEKGGTGVTQVLWSGDGTYLVVAERMCDGCSVWDLRFSGRRLAWLVGRKAMTSQRLGVDVWGDEVWAGGTDGMVRCWNRLGEREGRVESDWGFPAHEDAVCATCWHPDGSVLATGSGQKHWQDEDEEVEYGSDSEASALEPVTTTQVGENSLKVWAF